VAFVNEMIERLLLCSLDLGPSSFRRRTDLGFGGGTHHKLLLRRFDGFGSGLSLGSFDFGPTQFLSSDDPGFSSRTHPAFFLRRFSSGFGFTTQDACELRLERSDFVFEIGGLTELGGREVANIHNKALNNGTVLEESLNLYAH